MSRWWIAPMLLTVLGTARADEWDAIVSRGILRWGGDQEGGGPYIYPDPNRPRQLIGFEVELMDQIASRLGVRAQFQQCEWTNLPDLLRTGGIDVITNGYELTEAHQRTKLACIPYYAYELELLARRDEVRLQTWDDLCQSKGAAFKVGALAGSAAETYVRKRFGDRISVRLYSGTTDAMLDVQNHNLDATVQDVPAAVFFQNRFPGLHAVDAPVGRGYYVMYVRPGAEQLKEKINDAILALIRDGSLRAIYERYGIWNESQRELGTRASANPPTERATDVRGWRVVGRNFPILIEAAGMSVLLAFASMPLAIVIGLGVALGRLYGPRLLQVALAVYVEVLRGTPLLLQLYSIYYVLPPALGFSLHPLAAAVLGLALNYSAYESEIYRAGLLAIPIGQMEAALALGMTRAVALRRIIVPQAVRLVIPPVTNDFIALFKDTSICSVITVVELTKRYQILVNNTNAYLELMTVTAVLYLIMSYPLSIVARRLENRQDRVLA